MSRTAGVVSAKLDRLRGRLEQAQQAAAEASADVEEHRSDLEDVERAREIILAVAAATQEEVRVHIEGAVELALGAVFPEPYGVELEMISRRNRTDAVVWFTRGEEKMRPVDATGGGAVDVAAFALRPAVWSLHSKRTRPVFLLDEPFVNLSRDLQALASEMLRKVSRELGVQFFMVSHEEALIEAADRVFRVSQRGGRSRVDVV